MKADLIVFEFGQDNMTAQFVPAGEIAPNIEVVTYGGIVVKITVDGVNIPLDASERALAELLERHGLNRIAERLSIALVNKR